jgi:nucleoside-diphosphate-sugar epimerase
LRTEDDPPDPAAPPPFDAAVRDTLEMERMVLAQPSISGVVLRYGQLYGPGTWYARDGALVRMLRRRMYPIVGDGGGVFSWLHVDDAASATVRAVESPVTGVVNVVDDDPAPVRDWLPVMAQVFAAPPPRSVPAWLARLVAGPVAVAQMTTTPGVANARARRDLDWSPAWPSWREGFAGAPS